MFALELEATMENNNQDGNNREGNNEVCPH